MIKFERSFFDGEMRSDYYVSPIAKHNWAGILEVYAEIDRVCRKYDIPYWVDSGTLLGAVRHHGFIPWDDDFDIVMKRKDYNRFLQTAPLEFNFFESREDITDKKNRMFFHSVYSSKKEYYLQAIVMSGRKIDFDEQYLSRFHGSPFVSAIDIFPLDYYPGESNETKELRDIMRLINYLVYNGENWTKDGQPSSQEIMSQITQLGNMVGRRFDVQRNLRVQAAQLEDMLASVYNEDECLYIQKILNHLNEEEMQLFKKEWFDETVYLPFECMDVPCPIGYDDVLATIYGDYMTPVNYGGHGNPQLDMLRDQPAFANVDVEEYLEGMMKNYT